MRIKIYCCINNLREWAGLGTAFVGMGREWQLDLWQ